ncbi:hypothetical protein MHYP_G00055330 [Metynnis hypsauchen]
MVKEALVTQLDSFADRPAVPMFQKIFQGLGLIASNGYMWKMQRKFASSHLRYSSDRQKPSELSIQEESLSVRCFQRLNRTWSWHQRYHPSPRAFEQQLRICSRVPLFRHSLQSGPKAYEALMIHTITCSLASMF